MQERNLKVIEGLLFVLFILLWGLFLSGGSGKVKRRTLSLWQYIPVHTEVFHDFFENSIRKGQYELTPILGYDTYEGGKGMLLPFFRNGMQTELFPIQRFALDYWKGKGYYKAKYSDNVPGYFTESDDQSVEEKKKDPGKMKQTGTGRTYTIKELASYSFLLEHFYIVDETTSMTKQELNGIKLVKTDLSAKLGKGEPLVLIYHTHGSEAYRGSRKGRKSDTVIGVGDILTKRLEQKNIKVVHDRNIYDVKNGKEERSKAYNYAATAIEKNLKKYPSIQVVIDLHRDGVNESTKLVTRQNGKRMAQIMFFNGMSRTATNGNIKYLKNPNKQTNLAFSLQLQAQAALKYPGFTRKIYVKGYRYNLHYRGRSLLVEVGAQNNTLSEAKASMSLLAELLNNVLY